MAGNNKGFIYGIIIGAVASAFITFAYANHQLQELEQYLSSINELCDESLYPEMKGSNQPVNSLDFNN